MELEDVYRPKKMHYHALAIGFVLCATFIMSILTYFYVSYNDITLGLLNKSLTRSVLSIKRTGHGLVSVSINEAPPTNESKYSMTNLVKSQAVNMSVYQATDSAVGHQ